MSDEELARRQSRGRRMWDHYGSWLLLSFVGICAFMAGSAFNASSSAQTIKMLVESYERLDEKRVTRIRELNLANIELVKALAPKVQAVAEKTEQAVQKAEQAAQKATEAVERASGTPSP